ncbi:hypothetical protein JCM10213_000788 [Rhodosporidiobolus nylandii]
MADPAHAPAPATEPQPLLTKRRLTDALSSLDAAFKDPGSAGRAKKRKTSSTPLTSTPALEALLARSAPSPASAPAAPPASYDPTSLPSLLARLATYRLSSFSPSKPASLSALSCALHGWRHTPETRERIECVTCGRAVVLLPPSSGAGGWTSPAGKKLREEYERAVLSSKAEESLHKETCPWRMRPCARSLYRLPGGGLGVQGGGRRKLLEELAAKSTEMSEKGLAGMTVALPKEAEAVVGSEEGRERLVKAVKAVGPAEHAEEWHLEPITLLLAVFGWALSSPVSSGAPGTPSLSRSASSSSLSSLRSLPPSVSSADPILSCTMCHRQVLASSYLPSTSSGPARSFDPVKQHQFYCPFVDAYAGLPAAPPPSTSPAPAANPPPKTLKPGWQVRLEAVLQKPVYMGGGAARDVAGEGEQAEAGLVGGQKTKELLSYVRSLLGPKTGSLKPATAARVALSVTGARGGPAGAA